MSNVVRFKEGVLPITHLAPAGIRLLAAIERAAREVLDVDLTITCADKEHPPTDPHSTGEAFDIRTHDLTSPQKTELLGAIMSSLIGAQIPGQGSTLQAKDGGYVTDHFFGWIENPGQPNEHIHVQRRNNTVYP